MFCSIVVIRRITTKITGLEMFNIHHWRNVGLKPFKQESVLFLYCTSKCRWVNVLETHVLLGKESFQINLIQTNSNHPRIFNQENGILMAAEPHP